LVQEEKEEEEVANFCAKDDGSFWSHWIKPDAIIHAEEALVPRAARNTKSYAGANQLEMRKKKGPEPQEQVQKRRKADYLVPATPMIEGAISGVLPWEQGRC
jgi:chromodomain-helicase-DNA-binding protein 1